MTPEERLRAALAALHPSAHYVRVEAIDLAAYLDRRIDEHELRHLITRWRPTPEADVNGDVKCMRLWPVARCMYISGHYGGCATP